MRYNIYKVRNMSDDYTHKKGIVYKNQFHIIFCPKYRRKVLVNGVDKCIKEILFEIAREKDVEIKALEIMSDYVHIFIDFDSRITLHKIIKDFKGISSRIFKRRISIFKVKTTIIMDKKLLCLFNRIY